MSNDTEMLHSGETEFGENLKLERIVREVRQMRIRNLQAHISIEGIMSSQVVMLPEETREKERSTTEAWAWSKREKLTGWQGLPASAIVVYKTYRLLPITGRAVILIAHDSAPGHALPTLSPPPFQPYDPQSLPSVSVDPHAKQTGSSDLIARTVEAEIEVEIFDDKGGRRKIGTNATLKLKTGQRGFEEIGAELTFLKTTLADLKARRNPFLSTISKVRVTVKGEASLKLDEIAGKKALEKMSGELQASLQADTKVAKGMKLQVELVLKLERKDRGDGEMATGVFAGIVVTFTF
jgi:hypothetical protein